LDHNIGFEEKRQFFRRKWAKIAEISDQNIDPWIPWGEFLKQIFAPTENHAPSQCCYFALSAPSHCLGQGCQIFSNQKSQLGQFLSLSIDDVGIFYGHLVNFIAN
jgi:hypothetical protein